MFTYFSSDINDNLSSFAGPFIAENANKILKKEPSQQYWNEEFETPDTFLLVPRPSAPPLFRVMIQRKNKESAKSKERTRPIDFYELRVYKDSFAF